MPGVIMENVNVSGATKGRDYHDSRNGPILSNSALAHINGEGRIGSGTSLISHIPPELSHITQGFFSFPTLINRSVQQCWNDLSELITQLAEVQVPSHETISSPKSPGNQNPGNVQKKLRILDFAHGKRAEFIKLLVLSQWSRQAADVSRLIDLQNFIRARHQAYVGALQWVGDMKRDLVQAQVANPDLKTALEVLSKGQVVSMSNLGYNPSKPLTTKKTLKRLHKINKIISVRLALHDTIPRSFKAYHVHDGRVTFIVPGEFELDLSIGEENEFSQLYFVDIRFLFSPSSAIPKGRILNELDIQVNDKLGNSGLGGCFDLLHNLVLTNKINILFRQAAELAKGLWSDVLHIELLHRTLVVQYWASKPGARSWLEIGVESGRRKTVPDNIPYLGLRWLREGQEVDSQEIDFDTENLSLEHVLRSVIALHISHILSSAYRKLNETLLFSAGTLSLRAFVNGTEPGDCRLNIQLTQSRHLGVSIEPISGCSLFTNVPERPDVDHIFDKSPVDEIVSRISRLRCIAAIEEIESNIKMLGFETVSPRKLKLDARKIFPTNVLRSLFLWHCLWERNWIVAATSSMDGDRWWVLQLPSTNLDDYRSSALHPPQIISDTFLPGKIQTGCASFADLGHCLSGTLAIFANAQYLTEQKLPFHPPLPRLKIGSNLQVRDIFVKYDTSNLPQAMQVALPSGLRKRSFVRDTVRIAFHGVDTHKKAVIMVAYGSLMIPNKAFQTLVSKWDSSIVFRTKGSSFAIRLLAPTGYLVVNDLFKNLQMLECVLSIYETLQQKRMEPRELSLSNITFSYGLEKRLFGSIKIALYDSTPADLAHARLEIRFLHPNPHRRIQESLSAMLNHTSTHPSLGIVIDFLSLTLPLMNTFDQIMANPSNKEPLKVQIIVRSPTVFQIHYPLEQCRFQLAVTQHLNRLSWILKDVSVGSQDNSAYRQLKSKIQENLYDSKGDGWRGLGNGAIVGAEKVGNLILELHRCFAQDDLGIMSSNSEVKDHDSMSQVKQRSPSTGQAGKAGTTLQEPVMID